MNNPVIKDLIKLNLLKKNRLKIIALKVRNGSTKVFQEKNSKIILLEKNIIKKNYYSKYYENFNKKFNKSKKFTFEKIEKNFIKLVKNNEEERRLSLIKNNLHNNSKILDFGCGNLNFLNHLKKLKKYQNTFGVEKNKYILKENKSNFNLKDNILKFKDNFDVITMFHVLHYLPNQLETLKILHNKLSKNGKIFIELPNAEDVLFKIKDFRSFTFCKESLVWHTGKSMYKILNHIGFKNIKVNYIQRFGITNHLYWLLSGKPDGHNKLKKMYDKKINIMYIKNLISNKCSDTLWIEGDK